VFAFAVRPFCEARRSADATGGWLGRREQWRGSPAGSVRGAARFSYCPDKASGLTGAIGGGWASTRRRGNRPPRAAGRCERLECASRETTRWCSSSIS